MPPSIYVQHENPTQLAEMIGGPPHSPYVAAIPHIDLRKQHSTTLRPRPLAGKRIFLLVPGLLALTVLIKDIRRHAVDTRMAGIVAALGHTKGVRHKSL